MNIKCIIDDRTGYSLGNKIKDTYVLGTPYLLVIGDKYQEGELELEDIKTKEIIKTNLNDIKNII